jgi:hypothetical protein
MVKYHLYIQKLPIAVGRKSDLLPLFTRLSKPYFCSSSRTTDAWAISVPFRQIFQNEFCPFLLNLKLWPTSLIFAAFQLHNRQQPIIFGWTRGLQGQNYKIPLTYTKICRWDLFFINENGNEQPWLAAHFVYPYTIGVYCQQVYSSLHLSVYSSEKRCCRRCRVLSGWLACNSWCLFLRRR